MDENTAKGILNEFGVVNGDVVFRMNASADDLIDFLSAKCAYIRAIVALNKIDMISPEELAQVTITDENRPDLIIHQFRQLLDIFPGR